MSARPPRELAAETPVWLTSVVREVGRVAP